MQTSQHQYRVLARSIEGNFYVSNSGSFAKCLRIHKRWRDLYDRRVGFYDYGLGRPVPMLIVIGRL